MTIEDIMTRRVVTIDAGQKVTEAATQMKEENVGCLIVVDRSETVVGVVTDRDIIVRIINENLSPEEVAVEDCMTPSVVTAIPQMEIREAAKVMNQCGVRRLPIVDGRSILGIVSIADITIYAESILEEVSKARKR